MSELRTMDQLPREPGVYQLEGWYNQAAWSRWDGVEWKRTYSSAKLAAGEIYRSKDLYTDSIRENMRWVDTGVGYFDATTAAPTSLPPLAGLTKAWSDGQTARWLR